MACVVPVNPGGPFSMARTPYKLMAVYSEKPTPNTNAEINHCKRTKIQNRLGKCNQAQDASGMYQHSQFHFCNENAPETSKIASCWRVVDNYDKVGVGSWPLNPYPI